MHEAVSKGPSKQWSRLLGLALLFVLTGAGWVQAEESDSKLLARIDESGALDPYGELDLIVSFRSKLNAGQVELLESLRGSSITELPSVKAYAVRMAAVDALALRQVADVDYVTLDALVRSSSLGASVPSGSSGTPGFDSGVTGRGVTVAVLDSGIMDHPDLRDSLLGAVDFVDDARDAPGASDLFGHGTHVAGIIAGHGAGAGGTFSGIAPGTPLVSVRVLDGQGQGTSSGVIRGIEWATAHRDAYGIRVLTLSLGHPIHEAAGKDPLVRAVEAACAAGLVVVTSAGNFGQNGSFTITSPGNAPNAVTVGSSSDGDSAATNGGVGSATDGDTVAMNGAHAAIGSSTDGDEARAASASVSSFSSHGPTYIDHFLKPDLVAPGNAIVSLRAAGSSLDREFPDRRVAVDVAEEPAYFSMSGTSVAAPIVAATAALMLASEPDLEPATIKARLMLSANPGLDADLLARGAGLLDLPGALAQRVLAQNAASPRVIQAGSCCELSIEQPTEPWTLPMGWDGVRLQGDAGLWGDAVLWGDANLWGDAALWNYPVSWQDGIPVPD